MHLLSVVQNRSLDAQPRAGSQLLTVGDSDGIAVVVVVEVGIVVVVVVGDSVDRKQSKPRAVIAEGTQFLKSALLGSLLIAAVHGFGAPHGSIRSLHTFENSWQLELEGHPVGFRVQSAPTLTADQDQNRKIPH